MDQSLSTLKSLISKMKSNKSTINKDESWVKRYKKEPEPTKEKQEDISSKDNLKNNLETESKNLSLKKEKEEKRNDEKTMDKKDVIALLRKLRNPITLFGESDEDRYKRLCKLQEKSINEFIKTNDDSISKEDAKEKEENFVKMIFQEDSDKDEEIEKLKLPELKYDFEIVVKYNTSYKNFRKFENYVNELADSKKSDIIITWIKKLLLEWKKDIQKQCTGMLTQEIRNLLTDYSRIKSHSKLAIKKIQNHTMEKDIKAGLYLMVNYCLVKDYNKANEKYLDVAIGNTTWPMGVNMVGVHEKTGRDKMEAAQISHILSDETKRKYMQAIKRLITICEEKYPTIPSLKGI